MSDWKLLNTSTASGASSVEFTDLTGYKIFKFVFIDVNPATDNVSFDFNVSADGGSTWATKTTTFFRAEHNEADTYTTLSYLTTHDLAQSTADQDLSTSVGSGADESTAGELFLFNPASTTYVKHFYSRTNTYARNDKSFDCNMGGYANLTSALNKIKFVMSSGNFDGTIKQYGLVAT